ncbi:hypothetical protein VE03_05191 [Pseudogymnoascus sp. 23342-1-I1]|nr:hypothetical protein VE03_05191 [Pseudogymnoascus sp. 23342-1-I1]
MSYSMQMPGAWESDSEEGPIDPQPREPPLPLPQIHHASPPPPHQRRNIPRPTTQNRRAATFPKTTKSVSDYDFLADSFDNGNGSTTEDAKKPIVIAVFGRTGTGKSSFIKTVSGKDVTVGHGLTSCTEDVLAVPCRIDNENVILVDTPGFGDTNVTDTEILRRIAEWMKDSYDDGHLLSGIIYLQRISDVRMEGPSLKNLRMMRKLCGTGSLKNVVLATTMWENVSGSVGLERELELQRDFWKDMIDDGSTVARILTNKGDEARDLVRSLLKNKPLSTRLQEELHSGKTLVQTEAGTEIWDELKKQEEKLRKEHEAEIADLKLAQQSGRKHLSII